MEKYVHFVELLNSLRADCIQPSILFHPNASLLNLKGTDNGFDDIHFEVILAKLDTCFSLLLLFRLFDLSSMMD